MLFNQILLHVADERDGTPKAQGAEPKVVTAEIPERAGHRFGTLHCVSTLIEHGSYLPLDRPKNAYKPSNSGEAEAMRPLSSRTELQIPRTVLATPAVSG